MFTDTFAKMALPIDEMHGPLPKLRRTVFPRPAPRSTLPVVPLSTWIAPSVDVPPFET